VFGTPARHILPTSRGSPDYNQRHHPYIPTAGCCPRSTPGASTMAATVSRAPAVSTASLPTRSPP
jgi:hypothetical protein